MKKIVSICQKRDIIFTIVKYNRGSNPFSVDFTDFFYNAEKTQAEIKQPVAILTPYEAELLEEMMELVKERAPERVAIFDNRLLDLEHLANAISRFPSLLEKHDIAGGVRTPESLIDSLINHPYPGDPTLQLPSKATLGKGFLVAKMHTFSSLRKLSIKINAPENLSVRLNNETVALMFALLAEDVYLNLIRDTTLSHEYRRQWAHSLLLLWEHWTDQAIAIVVPVLQKLWNARRQLAPTFGTMMGTSELVLMSFQMDEEWVDFIKEQLGDKSFSQAMEEFLFGISYEQISKLRTILREKGIPAIGRDEVSDFLGENVKADAGLDYKDFYAMYTVRRDNARTRKSMNLDGPHYTLEDYFIRFTAEREKATKQTTE